MNAQEWLLSLKAGDFVRVEGWYHGDTLVTETTVVEKITNTQIVTSAGRYKRANGWGIGERDSDFIAPDSDEHKFLLIESEISVSREVRTTKTASNSTKTGIYSDLPKVLYITGETDSGEFGNARCPHCGAEGRYIIHFVTADGQERGAMKGCFSKFPQHKFAAIHMRLIEKERDYSKKGWNLPSWDQDTLKAIEEYAHGAIPEYEAHNRINRANERKDAYRSRSRR